MYSFRIKHSTMDSYRHIYGVKLDIKGLIAIFGQEITNRFITAYNKVGDNYWLTSSVDEGEDDLIHELRKLSIVKDEQVLYDFFEEWDHDTNGTVVFKYDYPAANGPIWIFGVLIPGLELNQLVTLDDPMGKHIQIAWEQLALKHNVTIQPNVYLVER